MIQMTKRVLVQEKLWADGTLVVAGRAIACVFSEPLVSAIDRLAGLLIGPPSAVEGGVKLGCRNGECWAMSAVAVVRA